MRLQPGAIYHCSYARWHHDQFPMLFVLYSDLNYVIGLNIHYIDVNEYRKVVNMFRKVQGNKRLMAKFHNNPKAFYHDWLKPNFKEFIDVSYRMYHQNLMMGIPMHENIAINFIGKKYRQRYIRAAHKYDYSSGRRKYDKAIFRMQDDQHGKHLVRLINFKSNSGTLKTLKESSSRMVAIQPFMY